VAKTQITLHSAVDPLSYPKLNSMFSHLLLGGVCVKCKGPILRHSQRHCLVHVSLCLESPGGIFI